ncbi:MAG: dTDP-4-dehydrorhamnose reductase [Rikenellaceae bacterium]|nr:dTDP-4-dehydrorhamnose reductase [Rikenellaceae bacterium]
MATKILVTGADGQLGSCLREIAPQCGGCVFVFTDVDGLDVTDREAAAQFMERERPQWVINTAAYTAVDKAEGDPEAARRLNADAVGILATESERVGASLLHISTDYVFGGSNPEPLTEEEPADPQSVYGRTKLEGERAAIKGNPRSVVIRTSWLYSVYGNNFVKTMLRIGAERDQVNVVGDQWGSPTSAHDLAAAIMRVVDKPRYGLYHYSNLGTASWALFAEQIMGLAGLNCRVNHLTTAEYPTVARRPAFSIMDKGRFMTTFVVKIAEWESALEEVIDRLAGFA